MSVHVRGKTIEIWEENEEKTLFVSNLGIASISEVKGLDSLGHHIDLDILHLNRNQLTKIEALDHLPTLQILDLSNNQITKIEGLDNLSNLEELDLSNNRIDRIEGLDKLSRLRSLKLSQNQVTKIEGLDKLPQLRVLELNNNQITNIEGLDKLPNLVILECDQNKITKIEGLHSLTKLVDLRLEQNRILKLEGLGSLTSLQKLNLGDNPFFWPPKLSPSSPIWEIVTYCQANERQIDFVDKKKYVNFLTTSFANSRISFKNTIPFYIAFIANVETEEFKRLETLGEALSRAIVTELVMNESESFSNDALQHISAFLTSKKMNADYCNSLQIPTVSPKGHYDRVFKVLIAAIYKNNGYETTTTWFKSTLFTQRIGPAVEYVTQRKTTSG